MVTSLLRFFGIVKDTSELDKFDPIFGLPKRSLREWLSHNPELKNKYKSKLVARSWGNHRRGL